METSEFLTVAKEAAMAGSKIVSDYFGELEPALVENKTDADGYQGMVTKADVESEQAIVQRIKSAFPDHGFLAEEEYSSGEMVDDLWIIDPLDGTNNFAHGIPHYAVSIAYYRETRPVCGCVVNPETGDIFTCEQGRGAWWNDRKVHVSHHDRLQDTMLGVGFYYDRGAMMRATLDAVEELFRQQIHGVRRMGTAALDIIQVGLGRFGGFFEYQLSPWDFAAAALFLTEAGGNITTCQGEKLPLTKTSVLASNGKIHQPLLDIVRRHANYELENDHGSAQPQGET